MAPSATIPVVLYGERNPPLGVFGTAKLAGVEVEPKVDAAIGKDGGICLKLPSGDELTNVPSVIRYLARSSTSSDQLYGNDALSATQVDEWISVLPSLLVSGGGLEAACAAMDKYLQLRTFLVGYSLTAADVAAWGQLATNLQWDKLRKAGALPHLSRWYDHCSSIPQLREAAELYNTRRRAPPPSRGKDSAKPKDGGLGAAALGMGGGDTGSFDVDLPNAIEGKVVTRFPPEPSGYLHIGHAKAALLNQYFADLYKGKMLMRFDDTNPSKENDEFVENIMADVQTLGLRYERLSYTSDYFQQCADLARKLIAAGHLYADDTPMEQMRDERMKGIESTRRNRSAAESLAMFEEMIKGSEEGRANCLRFKMDMSSDNGALRDPVAYRCNEHPHWRTGTTYKAYPTYDLACPFVDALEGVTHALRSSEYHDREEQYYRILKMEQSVWPGLPDVALWDFSRLSFVHTLMSKRKLKWFVDTGRVDGWADARFPTVQGLFRRGLQLEALREFILSQGASKNVTYQEWDKIWTMNKKVIDPVVPRHTAVVSAGKVLLTLDNGPERPEVITVPRHKKYPPAGVKSTTKTKAIWMEQADAQVVTEGEEVTLMDWGNAIIKVIEKDASGAVTAMRGSLNPGGNVKATKWKLTWLPALAEGELVPLRLVDYGYLLTKRKLEEDDEFEAFVNDQSKSEVLALGDANMRTLQKGEVLQLERKGYYIVDAPVFKGAPMVLYTVPDGRTKNVSESGGRK